MPGTLANQFTPPPLLTVQWGPPNSRDAVSFRALRLNTATAAQEHPALRTGPNVDRTGRSGLFAFVLDSLAGGFRPLSTIGNYGFDKSTVWKNEGVMVHIPGLVSLPYLLTTQTSVVSGDFSGYNAGNRRVHAVNWAASDGLRFIACVGPHLIKDGGVSNPALTIPSTSDNITDDVLTLWTGPFGSSPQVLMAGTDGMTDGVMYTTDPTANSVSWTSLVTFPNANDRCWGGAWMPQLGSGWHVFMGKVNDEDGWYAFQPTDTAPLTINTLTPVVWADTKDQPGSIPSTSQDLTFQTALVVSGWSDADNIFASDDAYATATASTGGAVNGLSGYNPDLSSLPTAIQVLGIEAHVEVKVDAITKDPDLEDLQLFIGTSATSLDASLFATFPQNLATSDTLYTTGDSTQLWGENWTRAMLQQLRVLTDYSDDGGGGAGTVISVDHIYATVYYQALGTQVVPTQGGYTIGPMPSEPNVLPTVEPVTDDETMITTQRVLKLNRFVFDPDGQRPVMESVQIPPLSMGYVGVAAHFQGGVVVIGGNNSEVFNECKLVDSEGIVRNLNLPKTHAGTAITVTKAVSQGNALLVWVANTDGTDAQLWLFFDGAWHALGPLQSKSNAMSSRPLYWAETVNGLEQAQGYLFIPNSTTSLMGTRQFIAPGLFDDPHITNTSEIKHDGPLAVTLPILDMGTIETQKALLTLEAQTFRLDDDTLYGTAQLEIDTTGDLDLTTPAVNVTFGTGANETPPFTEFATDADANNPGVSIPTAVMRLTLNHQTGTAKSPQPLPIVAWLTGQWPFDDNYSFVLWQEQPHHTNPRAIYERLAALAETKPTQWLRLEGLESGIRFVRTAFLGGGFLQRVRWTAIDSENHPVSQEYEGIRVDFRGLPGS